MSHSCETTFRSFPGSAWERTLPEALPQRAAGACKTVYYEAESHHESHWEVLYFIIRRFSWAPSWVAFISMTLLAGCQRAPTSASKGAAADPGSTAAVQSVSDPADVVRELEGVQAKVKRDGGGCIVEVDLRGTGGAAEVWSLVAQLPRVRSLLVGETPATPDELARLGQIRTLRNLDLRAYTVNSAGLQQLTPLTELRALRLSGKNNSSLDGGGVDVILQLANLKVLALDSLWVGAEELAQLQPLANLEELYLADTLVDDDALMVLAQFPHLKKLRIARTHVGDVGLAHLPQLSQLEELDLSENAIITDAGLANLSSMTQLTHLNLWRLAITDEGISHLVPLVNLQWLNLDNTGLTDQGLRHLEGMHSLRYLHLGSTSMTDAGLVHLGNLTQLGDLKLTRTAVTATGTAALQEKLPDTKIQLEYLDE